VGTAAADPNGTACEDFRFPEIAADRHDAKVSPLEDPPVAGTSGNGTSSSVSSTNVIVQTSNKIVTPSLIVIEPLFFISNTYDNYAASLIKSTAVDFFREDEILSAKSKLISAVEGISGLSIQHYCKTPIGANKSRTSFDDTMNIFTLADKTGSSCLPTFLPIENVFLSWRRKCQSCVPYVMRWLS